MAQLPAVLIDDNRIEHTLLQRLEPVVVSDFATAMEKDISDTFEVIKKLKQTDALIKLVRAEYNELELKSKLDEEFKMAIAVALNAYKERSAAEKELHPFKNKLQYLTQETWLFKQSNEYKSEIDVEAKKTMLARHIESIKSFQDDSELKEQAQLEYEKADLAYQEARKRLREVKEKRRKNIENILKIGAQVKNCVDDNTEKKKRTRRPRGKHTDPSPPLKNARCEKW